MELIIAGKVGWFADDFVKAVQHSSVMHRIKLGFVTDEQNWRSVQKHKLRCSLDCMKGLVFLLGVFGSWNNSGCFRNCEFTRDCWAGGHCGGSVFCRIFARGLEEALACTGRDKTHKLEEGKKQVEKFTWEKAGLIVLEVLHKVGGMT